MFRTGICNATLLYLASLLLAAIAYVVLHGRVARTGEHSRAARHYHHTTCRKGWAAAGVYALGMAASFLSPWLGALAAALVALFWMLPWGPLDALFMPRTGSAGHGDRSSSA